MYNILAKAKIMFYCDPVFAFAGMRHLLKYIHVLAQRAACAVCESILATSRGLCAYTLARVQLPCSYCVHGADVHGGGDQTLEKLETMENSENFKFDFMWNRPLVALLDLLYNGYLAFLLVNSGNESVGKISG